MQATLRYTSPIHDSYHASIKIPIDLSKELECPKNETPSAEQVEWDRKWMRGIRAECEKVEYISVPNDPESSHWEFTLKGFRPKYLDTLEEVPDPKNNTGQSSI
jgi:hypothetical protein